MQKKMQAQKKSKKQPKLWVFACLLFFFAFFCILFAFYLLFFCFVFAFCLLFSVFFCIFPAFFELCSVFIWFFLPGCLFAFSFCVVCFFLAFFLLSFRFFSAFLFLLAFFAFFFACFFLHVFLLYFFGLLFFCIIYCFSFRLAFLFTLFFFAFFPLKSKVLVSRISPVLVIISVVINLGMLNDAWWFSSQVFEKCASHCKTDRVMIADDCLILFLFGKLMGNFALWLIIFSCGQCALAMIR